MRASSAARRSGVAKLPPSISRDQITSASGRAAADHILDRGAAAGAREIVGVLAFGQQREAQAFAGLEQRQRQIERRDRRRFGRRSSPSKHRIGSSAIFHNSASWSSVSAVPSGATVAAKPAVTMAMTST